MKLLVFDLDGTLTATNAVDDKCFMRALCTALNIELVNTNWEDCLHVTDSGVTLEVFRDKYGRDPGPADISRFIDSFVSLLKEECAVRPDSFKEVPGASAFLRGLQQHVQWRAAIATGGWERSARFKMMAAGVEADGIPAAFAEHGPAREAIVEAAITKACAEYRRDFENVVLVGDAIWDVRTAQTLGLPFVGVGSDEQAALLRNAGGVGVIENFLDYERCIECFETAEIPNRAISGQG